MQNHTKETRMHRLSRHALLSTTLACAALAAQAQNNPGTATAPAAAPAPSTEAAPQAPAPNPAAEKALAQRFQALLAAFEGKAAVPDAKTFTEGGLRPPGVVGIAVLDAGGRFSPSLAVWVTAKPPKTARS